MNLPSLKNIVNQTLMATHLVAALTFVGACTFSTPVMAENVSEGYFAVEEKAQDELRSISVGIPKTGLLKATRVSGWKARYDSVEIARARSALLSLNSSTTLANLQ